MNVGRLRLFLDPFAAFKTIGVDEDALQYNRRHRGLLLAHVKRWAMIALACATALEPLAAMARAEPALCVPILGVAVYFVLGLED